MAGPQVHHPAYTFACSHSGARLSHTSTSGPCTNPRAHLRQADHIGAARAPPRRTQAAAALSSETAAGLQNTEQRLRVMESALQAMTREVERWVAVLLSRCRLAGLLADGVLPDGLAQVWGGGGGAHGGAPAAPSQPCLLTLLSVPTNPRSMPHPLPLPTTCTQQV